jgi:hypothetical protein
MSGYIGYRNRSSLCGLVKNTNDHKIMASIVKLKQVLTLVLLLFLDSSFDNLIRSQARKNTLRNAMGNSKLKFNMPFFK